MNRRGAVWGALLAAGTAWEFHELRDTEAGYPLTWAIRWLFQTETSRAGRAAFVGAVAGGGLWLTRHVLAEAVAAVEEVLDGPVSVIG